MQLSRLCKFDLLVMHGLRDICIAACIKCGFFEYLHNAGRRVDCGDVVMDGQGLGIDIGACGEVYAYRGQKTHHVLEMRSEYLDEVNKRIR